MTRGSSRRVAPRALLLTMEGICATGPEAATRGHARALWENGPEATQDAHLLCARGPEIHLARSAQVEACLSDADSLEVRR